MNEWKINGQNRMRDYEQMKRLHKHWANNCRKIRLKKWNTQRNGQAEKKTRTNDFVDDDDEQLKRGVKTRRDEAKLNTTKKTSNELNQNSISVM